MMNEAKLEELRQDEEMAYFRAASAYPLRKAIRLRKRRISATE